MEEGREADRRWDEAVKIWSANHHQVYYLILPVIANLLFTLVAWIKVYEMRVESLPVSLLFFDRANNVTTGNDFYDGMLNGFVCVASVALLSFIMLGFALYNFRRLIQCWLSLSCLLIMFCVSGTFFTHLLAKMGVNNVYGTAFFTLVYGIVGIYAFFTKKLPLAFHQFYVICNCSLVSLFYLQILPNHTTWFLLAGIVVWDIFAVLTPLGPLRQITGKAQDYSEDILRFLMFSTTVDSVADEETDLETKQLVASGSCNEASHLLGNNAPQTSCDRQVGPTAEPKDTASEQPRSQAEASTPAQDERTTKDGPSTTSPHKKTAQDALNESSARLGMGDFVFYSLLVGKAAMMGSILATMSAVIGVVMGLVITLTLLTNGDETTPALPVSVFLVTCLTLAMSVISVPSGPQNTKITRLKLLIKIALPHILIYLLIFVYLMVGAWAFRRLEYQAEIAHQQERLDNIEFVYRRISDTLRQDCADLDEEKLYGSLSHLSSFMERKHFRLSPSLVNDVNELLPSKWDSTSSILYALSILTTTGYGYASPMTNAGKFLTIAYGFIGIPLMFLAAVDLGRFLSEVVLKSYAKIEQAQKKIASLCGCPKKTDVISQVETKALKVLTPIKRRSITRNTFGSKKKEKKGKETNKKRLPLSVNASILLMFCCFGGLVYTAADSSEEQKNFIGAFFLTFNLVANLTMSEMPMDLSRILTLFYITLFVTFGLAVLSMCAELAAGELKWIFLKIHYFGRKINWKRKSTAAKKEEQMDMEVKELLKIINEIRAKHPEKKGEITSVDIIKYVQEMNGVNSYLTLNMFLQQHRRDTLAFMPQTIEVLKFADEMDETTSQHLKDEEKTETQSILNGLNFTALPYYV